MTTTINIDTEDFVKQPGGVVKVMKDNITDQQSEYWRWVKKNKRRISINNHDILYYITGLCWVPQDDNSTMLIIVLNNARNIDIANKLSQY